MRPWKFHASPQCSIETEFELPALAGRFWHVTWSTQALMTNRFPPFIYSLDKDAVRASKAIANSIDSASESHFLVYTTQVNNAFFTL